MRIVLESLRALDWSMLRESIVERFGKVDFRPVPCDASERAHFTCRLEQSGAYFEFVWRTDGRWLVAGRGLSQLDPLFAAMRLVPVEPLAVATEDTRHTRFISLCDWEPSGHRLSAGDSVVDIAQELEQLPCFAALRTLLTGLVSEPPDTAATLPDAPVTVATPRLLDALASAPSLFELCDDHYVQAEARACHAALLAWLARHRDEGNSVNVSWFDD